MAGELESRFGAAAKVYRREDLEIREYKIVHVIPPASPSEVRAMAGDWSFEFLVVLEGDRVVDAPFGESAPDEILRRIEGYEAWDRK